MFLFITELLEASKLFNNEPFLSYLVNSALFTLALLVAGDHLNLVAFCVLFFQLADTIGWFYTQAGINIQVLQAIDFDWLIKYHIDFFFFGIAGVVLLIIFVWSPLFTKYIYHISSATVYFSVILVFILIYSFTTTFYHNLFPFELEKLATQNKKFSRVVFRPLVDFFNTNITVKPKDGGYKNLIILEIESLETKLLGKYQPAYPESMRYVSNLSQHTAFCTNVGVQPYTTWSIAALFASQCNMPLLMPKLVGHNAAQFHLVKKHKCIGDFAQKAGYHLYSYLCNAFLGKFKDHLQLHGYDTKDRNEHKIIRDYDLYKYLGTNVIPNLTKKINQPFILHIANADTHAYPRFIADTRCKNRLPSNYPLILKSFDCVDQLLEEFMENITKSGLLENTEILLFGDHLLMGTSYRPVPMEEPRSQLIMVPSRPQKFIKKETSIFDFAPTAIDLMNMEISPKFPFGSSIFSPHKGIPPDPGHYQFIYDFFSKDMRWTGKASCQDGTVGFCRDTRPRF